MEWYKWLMAIGFLIVLIGVAWFPSTDDVKLCNCPSVNCSRSVILEPVANISYYQLEPTRSENDTLVFTVISKKIPNK